MITDKLRRSTLIIAFITSFTSTFMGSAVNLSIPAMSAEFNAGAVSVGWIVTIYILSSAVMSVPFGRIADMKGKRKMLMAGMLFFGISTLLCAVSPGMAFLLVFRLLMGFGAAMIFCSNQALLVSIYPPEQRGRVLGISLSATYLGLSFGPVIGGVLTQNLGWRSIFIISGAIILLIFLYSIKNLAAAPVDDMGSMDAPGNLLYILMLTAIMYGINTISDGYGVFFIVGGIILLVLFVRHELKVDSPIVDVRIFKNSIPFTLSNLAALLNYGASYALMYVISIYLQTVGGMSPQTSGILLIANPVMMAALSPVCGRLSDKIEPYKLATFGMAVTAAGLFLCSFITEGYPILLIIVYMAVIGVGFAFFSSPNTNAVMACVEKKDYSVATSILSTMRTMGQTSSMAVISGVAALKVGDIPIADAGNDAIVDMMHLAFLIFTGLCVIGTLFSAVRRRV